MGDKATERQGDKHILHLCRHPPPPPPPESSASQGFFFLSPSSFFTQMNDLHAPLREAVYTANPISVCAS